MFVNHYTPARESVNHQPTRLPPFGRTLADALRSGMRPRGDVWIYTGTDAWDAAKARSQFRTVLVLPENEIPESYNWPVRGVDVLVVETSPVNPEILYRLAWRLLCDGAKVVRVITHDNGLAVFREEQK